jgi:hypothetical protein
MEERVEVVHNCLVEGAGAVMGCMKAQAAAAEVQMLVLMEFLR